MTRAEVTRTIAGTLDPRTYAHGVAALLVALTSACGSSDLGEPLAANDDIGSVERDGSNNGRIAESEAAVTVTKMLPGTVPFYSEFDASENPNHYDWCAQGAFKVAYIYKTNKYISLKTLDQLLTTKYGNYSLCGGQKCSSETQLLPIATNPSPYLNLPNSVVRYVSNVTDFFSKVKDGVNFNFPAITGSYVAPYAPWGHYWVVVGYTDTGIVSTSQLYLRDVARSSAKYAQYDAVVGVNDFYHSYDTGHNVWYNANDMLFIKP
jgi:hypothetical protein